jgi:hypothetical protein
MPRLLAGADVFCQPNSGPKPFGIVLSGTYVALPVVATAVGGRRKSSKALADGLYRRPIRSIGTGGSKFKTPDNRLGRHNK